MLRLFSVVLVRKITVLTVFCSMRIWGQELPPEQCALVWAVLSRFFDTEVVPALLESAPDVDASAALIYGHLCETTASLADGITVTEQNAASLLSACVEFCSVAVQPVMSLLDMIAAPRPYVVQMVMTGNG